VAHENAKQPRLRETFVVAFYGDSITHGTHSANPDFWVPEGWDPTPVQHMAALGGFTALDYSSDGASSADAAIRDDASDLVVIRFGVADTVYRLTPAQFAQNITRLVGEAQALGKRVLLTGLTRARDVDTAPLDAVMRECAARLRVPFVDVQALPFEPGDLADGLHPGERYSRRVGEAITRSIGDIG
jgi:lysophospholipase L1-like esterase